MKSKQELMQTYWGPGGTVDMVKEYNAKHVCDVKPWECVKLEGVTLDVHPNFDGRIVDYDFALTILYDDKRKKHRPVFAGDKVYASVGGSVVVGLTTKHMIKANICSWNPPTPKRTFKLNDLELPCPDVDKDKGENAYFLRIGKLLYRFNELHNRTIVEDAINIILTAARDKE